ncbi:MAG: response regulator [Defluviitaleaceae bacterium]|nr:response regulator [Defluviitaleaceae bacterium]
MQIKEGLTKIKAINKDNYISKLDEKEFETYVVALEKFCDDLPNKEESIKEKVKNENFAELPQVLEEVETLLKNVNAQDLLESCLKCSAEITKKSIDNTITKREVEDTMAEHLRSLAELSIDIQMVLHKELAEESVAEASDTMTFGDLETEEPPKPAEPKLSFTILAVDDISFFLQIIRMHLQGTPFKVTCVNSGKAALRFIQNHHVDLYILDIEMPEMNGYELAKRIRAEGKKEPIIFLTSNASRKDVITAIQSGGSDFIIKPCNQRQILERITKHLAPKKEEPPEEPVEEEPEEEVVE